MRRHVDLSPLGCDSCADRFSPDRNSNAGVEERSGNGAIAATELRHGADIAVESARGPCSP
jgi:hypothetical protein